MIPLVAADRVPAEALRLGFNAAFDDYLIGPMTIAPEAWPTLLARQCVDLAASRVVMDGDDVAAFALVAPRPALGHWRLAAMGARPAARGSGAAKALLDDVIARGAGQAALELEVFADNARARALYESRGFRPVAELLGWLRAEGLPVDGAAVAVHERTLADALAALAALAEGPGPLRPLQVTPPSLAALAPPVRAWQHGAAWLLWQPGEGRVWVHVLEGPAPEAEALLRTLLLAHPGQAAKAGQIHRADLLGGVWARLGFERLPLHQLLMLRMMDPTTTTPETRP